MTATFPEMCKIAEVIPVHKGGESVNNNYTSTSLLPVLSKILEKNVNMHVRKHLETNNILLPKQHRFRQKYSPQPALGEIVGNLVKTFDKKHKATAVFINLRKAFNSVQHNILLSKLRHIQY